MAITAGAVVPLDEKRRRRHDLLAQLREVDHWRRLVAARLDLAVAAVTAIDEPTGDQGDRTGAMLPHGLREILGLPACDQALPEAAALMRLRAAQRDLDEYARALRESSDLATLELAALLDAERATRRAPRGHHPRPAPALASPPDQGGPSAPSVSDGPTPGTGPRFGSGSGSGVGSKPHLHIVTKGED
jgi:hypothetical protein